MNKLLLVLFCALTVSGCKNSLNVLAPYQDITVVYGLIDQNDSIHYIRINKAYQTAGNAYTAAAQYDSTHYPVGTLTVQLYDSSGNSLVNKITLDTTSGVLVVPGIFSFPYEVLYYTTYKLNPNDNYSLVVTNNKTKKVCTGTTFLLADVDVTKPINFLENNTAIDLSTNYSTQIEWIVVTPVGHGGGSDGFLDIRLYYNEIDSVKKDTTQKYIDWISYSYSYTGTEFLRFAGESIAPATGNIKRVPLYADAMITRSTSDFDTYLSLSQPSLTVNQSTPFYTDIKNAIGIFTAKHTQSAHKVLSSGTVDSLVNGSACKGLNFKTQ